jgi:hypothetical protein
MARVFDPRSPHGMADGAYQLAMLQDPACDVEAR